MTTIFRPAASARATELTDPAYQAFLLLRAAFMLAPIMFGQDKFFDVLTDWKQYLAPTVNDIIPGAGHQAMPLVALRDVGLFVPALALTRLAALFPASHARKAAPGPAA